MKAFQSTPAFLAVFAALLLAGCPQPTAVQPSGEPSAEPSGDPAPVVGDLQLATAAMLRDSWIAAPPLTRERAGLSAGTLNGNLFAIGGDSEATVEVLDPASGKWTPHQLPDYNGSPVMRTRSYGAAVAAWNRLLYIGGTMDTVIPMIEAYDPGTRHWFAASIPPIDNGLFERIALAAVTTGDEILVLGGMTLLEGNPTDPEASHRMLPRLSKAAIAVRPGTVASTLDIYIRPDMPAARAGHGAAVIDSQVYVVGGYSAVPATGSPEPLGSLIRFQANVWHDTTPSGAPLASLNTPRHSFATAVLDGVLYVAGGVDAEGRALDSVEAYDPRTNQWTLKAAMPVTRTHLGLAAADGRLYAIGGFDQDGRMLRSVHVYRP